MTVNNANVLEDLEAFHLNLFDCDVMTAQNDCGSLTAMNYSGRTILLY